MYNITCAYLTPFISLQVKNKPYTPTGENVFILENGAVANSYKLQAQRYET
jgi:hypothetical protein